MTAATLSVRGLVAGYTPDAPILRGVSLDVASGEIVTVLGPNGAGKSTLLKAIAGTVRSSAGEIRLGETPIAGVPTHLLMRRGLAYVPQRENVFLRLSVTENLQLGALAAAPELRLRIEDVFALFPDLGKRPSLTAGALSGGQRQMLALGRALMAGPRVLMLDEPSAGLSPLLTAAVLAKLGEIRARGISVLLVEQNARAALAISDRGYVLAEGRERFSGRAGDLLRDPQLGALYLGTRAALAS
jgi:ABC-type branched-subunit amino acid transport system ATPase component